MSCPEIPNIVVIYSSGTILIVSTRPESQRGECGGNWVEKHTLNLASLDIIRDIFGAPAIDLAANRVASSQDLLDSSLELTSERLGPHDTGDGDDFLKRDRLGVLDVLLLLAVPGGLLECLDDEGRCRWDNRDGGLTILDSESDGDTETFLRSC